MSYTMLPSYGVAVGIGVDRLSAVVVLFAACALLLKDVQVEAAIRPVAESSSAAMWCSPPAAVSTEPVAVAPLPTPKPPVGTRVEQPAKALPQHSSAKPRVIAQRPVSRVVATPAAARPQTAGVEMTITRPAAPVKPSAPSATTRSRESAATKAHARAEISANNFTKALSILVAPTESAARDPEHLALLAVSLVGLRRFDEAAEIYTALIAIDRNDPRSWVGLAVCDAQRGLPARSVAAYREAERLASNDAGLVRIVEAGLAGIG